MANEVATAWVSVVPTAKGFEASLGKEIGGAGDSQGKKVGASFGKAFGVGAALGAGAGAFSFMKGAIDGASDLEEATSKTRVVFGKAADDILKFSEGGAKAFGQTKNEVLAAASTFGTFGKAAGLSGKDLSAFSSDFVSLSADLASFHNASPQEAVEALGAALRGEAEPMRRFGVLLDDASMRQKALELGLISTTKNALTPQQKTLAAQALIMEQTKDAQGDFARTSDGLANSQRILSASFGDLQTKVGSFFLPVVTMAVQGAIGLVDSLSGLGPVLSTVGGFMQTAFTAALPHLLSLGETIRANFLPVVQQAALTFQTTILPALQAVGGYIVANLLPILGQIWGIFSSQVLPIVKTFASFVVGTLVPAVVEIYASVASKLKPVLDQLVSTFSTSVLPTVQKVLAKFKEWQPTIQDVILVVVKIIGKVAEFAGVILGTVLPPLIKFAGFLLENVVGAVSTVIGWIVKIVQKMLDFGGALVDGAQDVAAFASKVSDKIGEVVGFFTSLPGKITNALSGAATWLLSAGQDIVRGLLQGLEAGRQWIIDKVQELADLVPGWLRKKLGIHSPSRVTRVIGRFVADGMALGIKDGKTKVLDALRSLTDDALSRLEGFKSDMASLAGSVASAFKVDLFGGTLSDLLTNGAASVANLEAIQKAYNSLVGKGAGTDFLTSLMQSGNSALVVELDTADAATLAQAESIFAQQESLAAALGSDVGLAQFGDRIDKVTAEIAELRKDVKATAETTAKEFAKALNSTAANASKGKGGKGKGKK